jgi:hypothetical protein
MLDGGMAGKRRKRRVRHDRGLSIDQRKNPPGNSSGLLQEHGKLGERKGTVDGDNDV